MYETYQEYEKITNIYSCVLNCTYILVLLNIEANSILIKVCWTKRRWKGSSRRQHLFGCLTVYSFVCFHVCLFGVIILVKVCWATKKWPGSCRWQWQTAAYGTNLRKEMKHWFCLRKSNFFVVVNLSLVYQSVLNLITHFNDISKMTSRQNWLVQPWFSLKSTTNITFFPAADYFELMTWEPENNGGEKLGKGNPQFNHQPQNI